jgi:hypothetical protein
MALGGGGMLEYDAQRVFQRLLTLGRQFPGSISLIRLMR